MKALEKSKDADKLVLQLRASHDALVEQCTQSAETAAAGAQHYVPCAEGLASIAAKEREREMLFLSVSDMQTSCKTAVDSHVQSQFMLSEATRERDEAQTEVDGEKARLQDFLRADDGVGIVESATRLQQIIARRDTAGDKIPTMSQQNQLAAENASTHQMLTREAHLVCEHLDAELATLQQTMVAARDLHTGSLSCLTSSNATAMQESQKALKEAISYQRSYKAAHHDLFVDLSIAALKHMIRVTYEQEPSGNERAELQRDIMRMRERAAEAWRQLYDPAIVQARCQEERDEVAATAKKESDGRPFAYLEWAQRAGMLTTDAEGPSTDPDATDYDLKDEVTLYACKMLNIFPHEVRYAR